MKMRLSRKALPIFITCWDEKVGMMNDFYDCSRESGLIPEIGVGVIGHSFMGKVHSNAYLKIPFSYPEPPGHPDLVAICGRNKAAVHDVAHRMKYRGYYTDWEKLIDDPRIRIVEAFHSSFSSGSRVQLDY